MKLINNFFSGALLLIALFPPLIQAAASVLVWPIYQKIDADQQGSALWLENQGSQAVDLQIRVLSWQQQDQNDRFAEQQTVVASPPFARVPAGQRQMVRLIRTGTVPVGTEQAFRVIIDEIPGVKSEAGQPRMGIDVQMRYLLPLFLNGEGLRSTSDSGININAANSAQPLLTWTLTQRAGKTWLTVHNQGAVHARLSNVFWGRSNQFNQATFNVARGYLGYVLPGQKMAFPLEGSRSIPSGQTLYAQLQDNTPPVAIKNAL